MRAIKLLIVSLSLLLLYVTSVNAKPNEVIASVDKNPVMADESFNLTITANDDVDRSAFDPSVLMKDFVVGRTSVSTQTQMINFNTTRTTIWTTVLIPRKEGRFTIPAFDVGGQKTQAIQLMVVPVSSSGATQGRDIFITTEVDVPEAYLQQQLRYTVKLYLGQELQRGSLANPRLENADIRQIGKDKEYSEIKDGRRYRVIERTFAIIPQKSGTFTIEGPLFEGEIIDNSRQSFGFFNRSTPVNRVGQSQAITVLPIPSDYPHHWLPSDFVQINEEWQGNPQQYHVGEPITRTITLTAIGVVEEQLPAINGVYPNSVKSYPDQAETTTVEKDQTLIAQRKESVAIIPSEAGQLVLPAVQVPWFNVLTKKTEFTTLPEKNLTILPSLNQSTAPLPLSDNPGLIDVKGALEPNNAQAPSIIETEADPFWKGVSAVLFILWLLTLVLGFWLIKSRPPQVSSKSSKTAQQKPQTGDQWRLLQHAIKQSDVKQITSLLGPFLARFVGQANLTLTQSLQCIQDPKLSNEVNLMLASQYGQTPNTWDNKALHAALKPYVKSHGNKSKSEQLNLKPLYPSV
ncbi:BatD family protein [Flavobacterium sp. W21_SRS_FM6]|uniref:BatD family protein n=1 Tax=Flavobacterium sp. W21_SRS_FM6 TaxID=3240268 RepID=UPI003F8E7491